MPGRGVAVLCAQRAQARGEGAIHVLNFFRGRMRVAEAGIDADVGLHADELAEFGELVGAQIVGLHLVPGMVPGGRALVGIAYGVVPGVVGGVVAAEAPEARFDLANEGDGVRAEALDVVGGHQGDGADVEVSLAGAGDFEGGVTCIGGGGKVQRIFCVRRSNGNCDGFAIICAFTPDEHDLHLASGRAAQPDAAGVMLAFD